jgi:transposase-like protein
VIAHKKGISSCQLARDLNITQKTAWYVLKRIHNCLDIECIECLKHEVEADETYIGGKNKNRHKDKKVEGAQGRSTKDKKPVFGLAQRNGIVFAKVVDNTQSETIYPIIHKSLHKETTVYTDEYGVYVKLGAYFPHEIVNHGAGKYVIGNAHTNTMENYWSHLKRMIIGIHHQVSPKHLQLYVDCQSFRYNTRKISDSQRFNLFLHKIGHEMTYKKLINKT